MRGETSHFFSISMSPFNFNPLSPCGERQRRSNTMPKAILISIHSPHAGRDNIAGLCLHLGISFQSTLPMRGETNIEISYCPMCGNFNPLSPCGERQLSMPMAAYDMSISIHSPHAGRDPPSQAAYEFQSQFQSTLPMRGETTAFCLYDCSMGISIHSPHAGRHNKCPPFRELI